MSEFSTMHLEAEELLAAMWAIETACDFVSGHPDIGTVRSRAPARTGAAETADEAAEIAWAVHQRLQAAWLELSANQAA